MIKKKERGGRTCNNSPQSDSNQEHSNHIVYVINPKPTQRHTSEERIVRTEKTNNLKDLYLCQTGTRNPEQSGMNA